MILKISKPKTNRKQTISNILQQQKLYSDLFQVLDISTHDLLNFTVACYWSQNTLRNL